MSSLGLLSNYVVTREAMVREQNINTYKGIQWLWVAISSWYNMKLPVNLDPFGVTSVRLPLGTSYWAMNPLSAVHNSNRISVYV